MDVQLQEMSVQLSELRELVLKLLNGEEAVPLQCTNGATALVRKRKRTLFKTQNEKDMMVQQACDELVSAGVKPSSVNLCKIGIGRGTINSYRSK